eukprot:2547009-Rhodomonas_salina.1
MPLKLAAKSATMEEKRACWMQRERCWAWSSRADAHPCLPPASPHRAQWTLSIPPSRSADVQRTC